MTARTRDLLRASAATAALAALVVGVPVALAVVVGNPLPRTVPTGSDLAAALRGDQPVPDTVWINLIAALMWLAWARLAAGVAVEVATTVRRRPRSLDANAGAVQRSVGTLVATAALLFTLHHRPAVDRITLPRLSPVAATSLVSTTSAPLTPLPTAEQSAPRAPTWTVGPRDSLWRIAQRALGDGSRYPEIYALNRGRPQPDGGTLTNPSVIHQGWTLELPADATIPAAAGDMTVEPGDTLSAIAQRTLGDADRWPQIAAANTGIPQPDGRALQNPDLIRPGWRLTIPTDTQPLPAASPPAPPTDELPVAPPVPAPPTDTPPPTNPSPPAPTTDRSTSSDRVGDDEIARNLALVGLTPITAATVIFALRRVRRRRLIYRRPDQPVTAQTPSAQQAERGVRAIADEDAAAWIDLTIRLLTHVLREHTPPPAPILVRSGTRGVEILLDPPAAPNPDWFTTDDRGRTWQLRSDVELDAIRATVGHEVPATPSLVTIGSTPEGPVLADLEHLPTLAVVGDPARVRAFLNSVTVELAHAPWADAVPLLVDDTLPTCNLDRVRPVAADEIADTLDRTSRATATSLPGGVDTLSARTAADAPELWAPTIAIAGSPPDDQTVAALPSHASVAAVIAGPVNGAPWRLTIEPDGRAHLHPLDLELIAAGVTDDAVDATIALLTEPASDNAVPVPELEPRDELHNVRPDAGNGHHPPTRDLIERILTPTPVEVRVLQPTPTVDGWQTDDRIRAKSTEMVIYLAVQARPVRTDRLWHDLWPTDVAYTTFKTAVTRTRSALGADTEGMHHLREATDGSYRLSPEVGCDWARFVALTSAADSAPDSAAAIELLTAALRLVTGQPFRDTPKGHYGWAELDGTLTAIEVAVADAAHRLGQLALASHDAELATWAAAQGQLAAPDQLSLFETDMLARGLAGDINGIQRTYTAAQRVVCDLDALDSIPASTVDAYEQAMRTAHHGRAAS